ncbi:MAG: PGF-pre-PGF domain-containing protein, partial [ANME-2 cluster archaeon]|nr:PGF-pre-PGF domain-containing protein [ANME-2 cluster archaeon]
DRSIGEGAADNIAWIITDSSPDKYWVLRNGIHVVNPTSYSSGVEIKVSIDTTALGLWNYTIYANDNTGSVSSDQVNITVQDTSSPVINNPSDRSIGEGAADNIAWIITDSSPDKYWVLRNGIQVVDPTSYNSGEDIIVSIETTTLGLWNYTIFASDSTGNVASNQVNIIVKDNVPPAPITNLTAVDTSNDNGGSITLAWTTSTELDFAYYRIYRNTTDFDNVSGMNSIHSINLKSTKSWKDSNAQTGIIYYYAITSNDSEGNENKTVETAYAKSVDNILNGGSSSGGGSGGGGGTSGEAFANIVCTETDRQFVGKDLNVKYNFKLKGNYVQHIQFTGLTGAGKVAAKVEILNHTSTIVKKDAPNIVFKNLNVWIGNMGYFSNNNIKDPTITFIVDRSWVRDNDIILNTISFYSYNDRTRIWEKMSTQKIGEDSTSYLFKASLPIRGSLGPMAISGREVIIIPTSEPTADPGGLGMITTPTQSNTEQNSPEITPTTIPVTWTGTWMAKVPGFQLLAALIPLITLYFISRRRD